MRQTTQPASGRRRFGSLLLVSLAAASALVAASCSDDEGGSDTTTTTSEETGASASAAVLRLGVVELDTLDPAAVIVTEQSEMIAVDLLYDGLTEIDPASEEAVGSLAESWEPSEDLTTWTFTLRDDATFADGSAVTAADAKASLERVAALGDGSLAGLRLDVIDGYADFVSGDADEITGLKIGSETELEVVTAEPYGSLPELMATPVFGVLPVGEGELGDDFFDEPVGSGPFVVVDRTDERMRLEARPEAEIDVEAVELVRFETVDDSYAAFEDGEVDWSLVPVGEVADAVDTYGADSVTPFHAVLYYGINVGNPKYDDPTFRRAILQAVDRAALVDDVFAEYSVGGLLDGLIPEGVPGHRENACGEICEHDPDAAADALAELFPAGDIPTVNIDFFEGEREQAISEALAEDLDAVGIPTELRPQPPEDYDTFITGTDQEVFLFGWVGIALTPDSYVAPLFLTESPDNVTGFGNDVTDAGIAAARSFDDRAESLEAYQAVEDSILEQVPLIPLAQFDTGAVVSDRVKGWMPQLDGTFVVGAVSVEP